MFGIGFGEFLLLAIIIFVLIGPKQLPEVMKVVGNIARELTKARRDLSSTIDQDDSLRSIRESVNDVKQTVKDQVVKIATNIHDDVMAKKNEDSKDLEQKSSEDEKKSHE
jgi:Sec-independent protein translocase protein TatA